MHTLQATIEAMYQQRYRSMTATEDISTNNFNPKNPCE